MGTRTRQSDPEPCLSPRDESNGLHTCHVPGNQAKHRKPENKSISFCKNLVRSGARGLWQVIFSQIGLVCLDPGRALWLP